MDSATFMRGAFDALVSRGVIKREELSDISISGEEFAALEKDLEIEIPEEVRAYFRAYGHSFTMLKAATPEDFYCPPDPDIMKQISTMTPEEIAELDEDDIPDIYPTWSDFYTADKDEPLKILRERIEGFREFASFVENPEIDEEQIKRFLPIGEWMSAGCLCIDTSKKKEDVDPDDPDTWQIRWFDHEELDWEDVEYVGEDGEIKGEIFAPDFETVIRLYFYGAYDKAYLNMCEEEGEEPEDMGTWAR